MPKPLDKRQPLRKKNLRETEKLQITLGRFVNFPSMIHGIARVSHQNTTTKLQQAIIQTFYKLNESKEKYTLSVADHVGTYNGEVTFEVGVADGLFFNFLNQDAFQNLCTPLKFGKEYSILDFLVVIAYRYFRGERKISLNFDHYIVRFAFYNGSVEATLFHSKGTRRMPLDEFLNLILKRLSNELKQMGLKPITVHTLKTL